MIHGEPTWDCFSLSKAPLSSLLKGKVELSGLWHDDVMVRKWKFALLLVFKDETAFCYRALHHHHQERVLSLSSPSSPTGLKGRMEERLSLLPNHGCQIQHAWGEKKNLKKMSGISFELLFLQEERGSWRGEEAWDVYEVCRDFWRKLTEGGQMVGGTGNVILSLSLLGRPVQTQPRSRMAQSHLQQMAILVLHEKNGWWGSAPCQMEDRAGFFPSWSISGDKWEKVQRCTEETRLMARTRWRCPGTQHPFSKPRQGITMGCRWCCSQEAASPRKEVVCPPASAGPQTRVNLGKGKSLFT